MTRTTRGSSSRPRIPSGDLLEEAVAREFLRLTDKYARFAFAPPIHKVKYILQFLTIAFLVMAGHAFVTYFYGIAPISPLCVDPQYKARGFAPGAFGLDYLLCILIDGFEAALNQPYGKAILMSFAPLAWVLFLIITIESTIDGRWILSTTAWLLLSQLTTLASALGIVLLPTILLYYWGSFQAYDRVLHAHRLLALNLALVIGFLGAALPVFTAQDNSLRRGIAFYQVFPVLPGIFVVGADYLTDWVARIRARRAGRASSTMDQPRWIPTERVQMRLLRLTSSWLLVVSPVCHWIAISSNAKTLTASGVSVVEAVFLPNSDTIWTHLFFLDYLVCAALPLVWITWESGFVMTVILCVVSPIVSPAAAILAWYMWRESRLQKGISTVLSLFPSSTEQAATTVKTVAVRQEPEEQIAPVAEVPKVRLHAKPPPIDD